MFASSRGHHQVVELLSRNTNISIQRKGDISAENIITAAFMIACYEGHSSIVIFLSKKLTTCSSDESELL